MSTGSITNMWKTETCCHAREILAEIYRTRVAQSTIVLTTHGLGCEFSNHIDAQRIYFPFSTLNLGFSNAKMVKL